MSMQWTIVHGHMMNWCMINEYTWAHKELVVWTSGVISLPPGIQTDICNDSCLMGVFVAPLLWGPTSCFCEVPCSGTQGGSLVGKRVCVCVCVWQCLHACVCICMHVPVCVFVSSVCMYVVFSCVFCVQVYVHFVCVCVCVCKYYAFRCVLHE